MKHIFKHILTVVLVLSMLACAVLPAYAAKEEEYLCDLRIIYADDYNEAKQILSETDFAEYEILDANLNENTGKIGVWLAYKTTTDIEDAITDIAIMQMNGGYKEGNYREMIKQSYNEYLALGENYLVAIEYFAKAYEAGNYLSEVAFRQLNFYNVVTEGIDEIPEFEGERLGDIFCDGIDAADLATMFMEGNSYALANVRSLIAMGVSYNEDGMNYLEKVAAEVEALNADPNLYSENDYDTLAAIIEPTIVIFGKMFAELEANASELNYEDEEITEQELKYLEYMVMAEMLRDVQYLGDKTLYQFCMEYQGGGDDLSALYPLVAALNEGQVAMTQVAHYYDVVRYSMTLAEDEEINAELDAMEAEYGEYPFNIYTGVDRTVYRDSFALTSAAYRADAYTESGLSAALYEGKLSALNIAATVVGSTGALVLGAGLARHGYLHWSAKKASDAVDQATAAAYESYKATQTYSGYIGDSLQHWRPADAVDKFYQTLESIGEPVDPAFHGMSFQDKVNYLDKHFTSHYGASDLDLDFANFKTKVSGYVGQDEQISSASANSMKAAMKATSGMRLVYGMYVAGGIMMLASAITLGISVYNYYYPTYDDIPTAMVDLIDTVDGDRYVKYDVVYEAEQQKDGSYAAADLNAFKAQRWNAMYYTKSYEAGKPLLADAFVVSTTSNAPAQDHMPVHRFGEVVCFNLNKYNFNEKQSIYLSVKQSENQKAAVAGVPEVVGSMMSTGVLFLIGGAGLIVGVGGTIGVQAIMKKKKSEE